MTQVNDNNSARLPKQKATPVANAAQAATTAPGQVKVEQGNVPLLTVQLLDLILQELRTLNKKFEHIEAAKNG